ncbi:unnamed protein product [Didymodactylos carnosus]|uniref:Potassium channel domain-containing protein n=1 Tax=Didymodactylos carnosus TaxID=1234261 RepID=A0A813ZKJ3_9BILA|nr:unnamed protein product [Didymodactylos carnosus]CAF0899813.1 unnamed protein product [Didymodactylos carnosus]CAF3653372.1 unnamed protein product [Didymodactylos carnosus]CAF3682500.1 unnamed protein product [Didymodactylos carnosus]
MHRSTRIRMPFPSPPVYDTYLASSHEQETVEIDSDNNYIKYFQTNSKTRSCLKKTAKFLFSHLGLVGLVVVYSVAGGFLFELLEQHEEMKNCQQAQGDQQTSINQLKQTLVSYIQFNTTSSGADSTKDNMTTAYQKIGSMLIDFRTNVLNITSTFKYEGQDCSEVNKWTFPGALLFSITVITTIGFGNITPVTWEGQICCLCYATIGIPIFLLCVANISGVLGEMFRFLYSKIICRPCYTIKRKRHRIKMKKQQELHMAAGWTMDDDYDMDTRGNGNKIQHQYDDTDDDTISGKDRVTVPLTITMFIIAGYIWAGSVLFHEFEEWTMIQSGYFCFITLATIGFGDFVPGQRKDDPNSGAKLMLGAIYVLFGMAILAMCFDLMQEEIVAKFRWIGEKIGIIEDDDGPDKRLRQQVAMQDEKNETTHDIYDDNNGTTQQNKISNTLRTPSPRINQVYPAPQNYTESDTLHLRLIKHDNLIL